MTTPDWADRFRAARKRAGFSASWKLADQVGASHRQAIRWETGEALPDQHAPAIAAVNDEFAALIAELPDEEDKRRDLARRLAAVEQGLAEIRSQLEGLLESRRPPSRAQRQRRVSR